MTHDTAGETASSDTELVVHYRPLDSDRELRLDLSGWPGSVPLRSAFAQALRHVTGPIGTWQRAVTVRTSLWPVKALVTWLAEQGVTSVAEFTPAVWNAWRLHLMGSRIGKAAMSGRERLLDSRVAVLALPGLRAETARTVEMRIGRVHRVGEKPFYTKEQLDAIAKAASKAVWVAHRRITANWRLMNLADDEAEQLAEDQRTKRTALLSLMENGAPCTSKECMAVGGVATGTNGRRYPVRQLAFAQLWFTRSEGLAAATWLAILTGEDWSVIDRKTVPSTAASLGDGETVLFTRDSKPRRGPNHHDQPSPWRADTTTGAAGRALRLITEACTPAREFRRRRGLDADTLIYTRSHISTSRSAEVPEPGVPGNDTHNRYAMIKAWWPWLLGDGPALNFTALRNTHQAGSWRGGQAPAGHTPETHLQYRLANPSQVEAGRDAALAGLQEALDVARQTIAVQIRTNDAGLDPDQDMVGVNCADHQHNPTTGAECEESFLACFDCPNGCITPRHLPIDVLILDGLENLRAVLPPQRWRNRFLRHYLRVLSALQQAGVDDQRRNHLRGQATEQQRRTVARAFSGDYG